ncbi:MULTISPECIES: hypothetical protein [unclassified Frigoribacterium]|jgi:hypothetical protein|uniref:hypothetical protein n=1 Tax=unclassified Frigoribacterium TaxID=2627005 RepID=UPI0005BBA519|nr:MULTISPECIES: hypothetical protein [unclassified Frigoribacterium]KIU02813.1 hypothetical protein SZ60_09665 [Frigoribacterium sp. MEB024]KQO47530.1 hypothetical protein ASF07_08480 [Frigoribacterium sp. Leaf254]KQT39623.1 hypothetical protein ASG28_08485 [Frigoribacterium sp. Leaf415]MBD8538421.1 hypothetical protein [Frigoribacterium sp. CFBP 8751]
MKKRIASVLLGLGLVAGAVAAPAAAQAAVASTSPGYSSLNACNAGAKTYRQTGLTITSACTYYSGSKTWNFTYSA